MSQDYIADLLADAVTKLSPSYGTYNTEYPIKISDHKKCETPFNKKAHFVPFSAGGFFRSQSYGLRAKSLSPYMSIFNGRVPGQRGPRPGMRGPSIADFLRGTTFSPPSSLSVPLSMFRALVVLPTETL